MPAKGNPSERRYDQDEAGAIKAEAAARGMTRRGYHPLAWREDLRCVPERHDLLAEYPGEVWGYRIGGYQVIKKWLSYREQKLLGRSLKPSEAREVMNMARRIAAIILLQPKLDANYHAAKSATYAWGSTE